MHSCHHRFTASLLQKSNILYSVNIYWKGCLVNTSRSWSLATSIIAWSASIRWRWCYFSCNSFTARPSSTSRIPLPHFKDLQYVWNQNCEKITRRSNDALKYAPCFKMHFWFMKKKSTNVWPCPFLASGIISPSTHKLVMISMSEPFDLCECS